MRDIIFRGKSFASNSWVYGYYVFSLGIHYIAPLFDPENGCTGAAYHEIDPKTLGQKTGLEDKNGVPIWEGDILRYSYDYPGSPWLAREGKTDADIKYSVGMVFWKTWRGTWAVCGKGKMKGANQDVWKYSRNPNRVEVVGNVFDNPELVEEDDI